jgi:protein O-mannosyl-transferase
VEKPLLLDPPLQRTRFLAALLLLCAVIAYIPAIGAGFIWDDDLLLTANPQMQSLHGLAGIWLGKNSCDYTPLTLTTFWLEQKLWGDTPTGYHVINILLHGFGGVLLWRILSVLRIPGSWLAALIFVVHPVNVASVTWVAERKNTLSAALFLSSVLVFLLSCKRDSRRVYLGSIGLFILAGLSKGAVVTMPIVLCGCILGTNKRITRGDLVRLAPFLIVSAVIASVTVHHQARAVDYGLISSSFLFRITRAGAVIWLYLSRLAFPIAVSPMLPPWPGNTPSGLVYLPGLLAVATLGLFFWKRKSWGRPFLFASGYYVAMLLPVLGFFWMALQQETPCADWWQYLAAPGIFAGIAAGFVIVSNAASKKTRLTLQGLACFGLVLLLAQTWRRTASYQSMENYCRAVLAENPHAWTVQTNLGVVLEKRGEFEQAIACYRQALADNPRFMQAHNNLGNALSATGSWPEAEAEFLAALRLSPSNSDVLGNLADTYFRQGKVAESFAAEAQAIRADRYNPQRYVDFGRKLAANKQFEQATVCFKNALLLNPRDVTSQVNLAQALMASGHGRPAAAVWKQALQIARDPGDQPVLETIASLRSHSQIPEQK